MKKTIIIILGVLVCGGCVNSDFTVDQPISPAIDKYDDPQVFVEDGFALTDQISRNAVDNLMGF